VPQVACQDVEVLARGGDRHIGQHRQPEANRWLGIPPLDEETLHFPRIFVPEFGWIGQQQGAINSKSAHAPDLPLLF
jgi:hypothetical protein